MKSETIDFLKLLQQHAELTQVLAAHVEDISAGVMQLAGIQPFKILEWEVEGDRLIVRGEDSRGAPRTQDIPMIFFTDTDSAFAELEKKRERKDAIDRRKAIESLYAERLRIDQQLQALGVVPDTE